MDYTQLPLNSGAAIQPANGVNPPNIAAIARPAATAGIEALAKGMDAARQNAAAFEEAAIERNNYTVDQMRQTALMEAQAFAHNTLTKRLSYADGAPGALYDANGNFNEEEYSAIKDSVRARLSNTDAGYIGDTAKSKARAAGSEQLQKIFAQMDASTAGQMAVRARRATMRNAEAALATGDTATAAAIINGAPDWVMNEADRTIETAKINQKAFSNAAETAIGANDTTALLRLLTDPAATRGIDPATLARYTRALNNMGQNMEAAGADINTADGLLPESGSYTTISRGSGSARKELRKLLPNATPDYIYNLVAAMDAQGEDFKDGKHIEAARALIPQLVAQAYTTPGDAEQRAKIKSICSQLGTGNAEYADELIKQMDESHYGGNFSASNWLKSRPKEQYWSRRTLKDVQAAKKGEGDEERNAAVLAWWNAEHSAKESEFNARVLGDYEEWYNARAKGPNKPTYKECELQMYNIFDSHQAKYIKGATMRVGESAEAKTLRDEITAARKAEDTRNKKNAEEYEKAVQNALTLRELEEAFEEKETAATTVTEADITRYSCDIGAVSTAKLENSLEKEIIYVPRGHAAAGQSIHIAAGNRSRMAEVREADVSTPALSTRLQIGLGLFRQGASCELLFNGKGRAIINNNNVAPRRQMMQFIYNAEARRDKEGNLLSYASAEGKEYAGLNRKYDNTEVEHIDAMREAGATQEEIKEYIFQAYERKTTAAADMLTRSGIDSPALEYVLRDIYFNQGEGGLNSVLAAAVGGSGHLAAAYTQHGERAVIEAVIEASRARHNRLADNNARLAKYKQGWANRNTATLNNALTLLK